MHVPQKIGPYPITRLLGQGAMGAVYLGHHPTLNHEVAIKLLVAGRNAVANQRMRFQREVAALSRLRHPGLVQILEAGEEQGGPWFAMRRVEGVSLGDRLDVQGPLPITEAVELGVQLCAALGAAHAEGIVHRDLKPDNVICSADGQAVIVDFGLVKDLETEEAVRLSLSGMVQGTPCYWAPEQARGDGGAATVATDVYSLGATLYAALTGVPPIDGDSWVLVIVATQERRPEPPSSVRSEVPRWLDQVVLRCLEKEPSARYESVASLSEALRAGPSAVEPPNRIGVAAAGLIAVGILIAASLWALGPDPTETQDCWRCGTCRPWRSEPGSTRWFRFGETVSRRRGGAVLF